MHFHVYIQTRIHTHIFIFTDIDSNTHTHDSYRMLFSVNIVLLFSYLFFCVATYELFLQTGLIQKQLINFVLFIVDTLQLLKSVCCKRIQIHILTNNTHLHTYICFHVCIYYMLLCVHTTHYSVLFTNKCMST